MTKPTRRDFVGTTTRASVAFATATTVAAAQIRADAKNDRIVLGAIGIGGRGRQVARSFAQHDDVEVAYLCDPDRRQIGRFDEELERIQGRRPKVVADLRRVLEDGDVDAVCVCTCDHWHALATVWACQAGKDVYVEKPPSHNLWEGRKMVEAARKYGRVVQVGTQSRSAAYVREAIEYIQAGQLGDIPLVKVHNVKAGGSFTMPSDEPVPEGVDYNLYLGPAPQRPFNTGRFHVTWMNHWDYSNGDSGVDGIHQLDLARWLIGDVPYPDAAYGTGGNLAFDDDRETPDTQSVTYEYPGRIMTFEHTQFAPYMTKTPWDIRRGPGFPHWPTNSTRIELYGTKELMYLGRHGGGWQAVTTNGEVASERSGAYPGLEHFQDFIDCVRSRKHPAADIETGHQSAVLMHLGSIATRLGGRRLIFDGKQERIEGDAEANALLCGSYRAPFVVPSSV